jgi:hypothetical protein
MASYFIIFFQKSIVFCIPHIKTLYCIGFKRFFLPHIKYEKVYSCFTSEEPKPKLCKFLKFYDILEIDNRTHIGDACKFQKTTPASFRYSFNQ